MEQKYQEVEQQDARRAPYQPPELIAVDRIGELVQGGSGFASDGANFEPL